MRDWKRRLSPAVLIAGVLGISVLFPGLRRHDVTIRHRIDRCVERVAVDVLEGAARVRGYAFEPRAANGDRERIVPLTAGRYEARVAVECHGGRVVRGERTLEITADDVIEIDLRERCCDP
jgi:hypothetical protein